LKPNWPNGRPKEMPRDNGTKLHVKRPGAGTAARMAWDDFVAEHGSVVNMQLIDGVWMCELPDGRNPPGIDGITARWKLNRSME
jgi:hypothetical protein